MEEDLKNKLLNYLEYLGVRYVEDCNGCFNILNLTIGQKKNLCDFCINNGLILTEKLSYDVDESDRFKYYNGQVKYTYKGSRYYICKE